MNKNGKIRIAILFFGVVFVLSMPTWGADEVELTDMAKTRTYLGGPDESDLKVQAVLPKNLKSKNETVIEDEGF